MKITKLLFTLLFFTFSFSLSIAQTWLWGRQGHFDSSPGGEGADGFGIAVDNSHNAIISGFILYGNYNFGPDTIARSTTYVVKYDPNGNVLWAKGSSGFGEDGGQEEYNVVATDPSNNVFVDGTFSDSIIFAPVRLGTNSIGAFMVKYDSNGNALWGHNSVQSSILSHCYGLATAADNKGNSFITGCFFDTVSFGSYSLYATNNTLGNVFVVKYNANGIVQWAKQSSNGGDGSAVAITTDSYGNVYATGIFISSLSFGTYHLSSSFWAPFIVKYDSNGNVRWAKQGVFKNGGYSNCMGITVDKSNKVYITGSFDSTLTFGSSRIYSKTTVPFIIKYDTNGNVAWAKQGDALDKQNWFGYSLSSDGNNHIFFCGGSLGNSSFKLFWSPDTIKMTSTPYGIASFVVELDTSGKALRNSMVIDCNDGNDYDGCQIASDKTGNYVYLGGDIEIRTIFGKDTLTSVIGNIDDESPFIARWQGIVNNTTGMESITEPIISSIRLFPNPSNGIFTLRTNSYQSFANSYIEVYNMLGAKVYNETLQSVQDDNRINLSNQHNGVYLYRVLNENGGLLGEGKVVIAH